MQSYLNLSDGVPVESCKDASVDRDDDALYDNSPLTSAPPSAVPSREPSPERRARPPPHTPPNTPFPEFEIPTQHDLEPPPFSVPVASFSGGTKRPLDLGNIRDQSRNGDEPSKTRRRCEAANVKSSHRDSDLIAPTLPRSNQRARRKKSNHEHRRKKRAADRAANSEAGGTATEKKGTRCVNSASSTQAKYTSAEIPSASTGYTALPDSKGRVYTLNELVDKMGFEVIKAEKNQPPRAILDKNGLIVAVIVGAPKDPEWDYVHEEAHQLLLSASQRCRFDKATKNHRRGKFGALNVGIAFGNGMQVPGNLSHNSTNKKELEDLLTSRPFNRIAGFMSSAFKTWAPKLYKYYDDHLRELIEHHRGLGQNLTKNFSNSVWATAAFNFGPRTVTNKHRDCQNLPFGWCGITALGKYNFTLGGHIVFWELKLVVEFPPGFTVLLPSAAVAHSNTPIQRNETRTSFTQYTSGGIFRWVQHGFRKEDRYSEGFTDEDWQRVAAENAARCLLGTKLFSTFDELKCPLNPSKDLHPTET